MIIKISTLIIIILLFNNCIFTNQQDIFLKNYKNSYKSNNDNNNSSNIYVSKNGNDGNNGTIEFPYYSICKVLFAINGTLNYDQINVYIGSGEYDCSNCSNFILKDHQNIVFSDYNNNLDDYCLKNNIFNNFNNKPIKNNINNINIINFNLALENSTLIINNINFIYNTSTTVSNLIVLQFNSFLYFNNSLLNINNIYNSNNIYSQTIILENSVLEFSSSSVNNIQLEIIESTFLVENCNISSINIMPSRGMELGFLNSKFYQLFILPTNNDINYSNNKININDCIVNFLISINNNTINDNKNYIFPLITENSYIKINKSKILSTYDQISNSLVEARDGATVEIINTLIKGWSFMGPVITLRNSSAYLEMVISYMEGITFLDCHGSLMYLDNIYFNSGVMSLFTLRGGVSNVTLSSSSLTYYYSGLPLVIETENNYLNLSQVVFQNVEGMYIPKMNITGYALFVYASRAIREYLFKFKEGSTFYCNGCLFSVDQTESTLMIMDQSNITLYDCDIRTTPKAIVAKNSNITIIALYLENVYTPFPTIQLENSNLIFIDSNATGIFLKESEFIHAISSTVYIENFQTLNFNLEETFISLNNSVASVKGINIEFLRSQNGVFTLMDGSSLFLEDSNFENILATTIFSAVNGSTITLSNNIVTGTSYNVFFKLNGSVASMEGTSFSANKGSLLLAYSSSFITLSKFNFKSDNYPMVFQLDSFISVFSSTLVLSDFSFNQISFSGIYFFKISNDSVAILNNVEFIDNSNIPNILYSENRSKVSISNSKFVSNSIFNNNLFSIQGHCQVDLNQVFFYNNTVNFDSFLINLIESTLKMNSSEISKTTSKQSSIGSTGSLLEIQNSIFNENFVVFNGGVMNLDHLTNIVKLENNVFIKNKCLGSGGVFYTNGFKYSIDKNDSNIFLNNSSIYGNIIASEPSFLKVSEPIVKLIYIALLDRYSQLVSIQIYPTTVSIQKTIGNDTFDPIKFTVLIRGGQSSFDTSIFHIPVNTNLSSQVYSLNISIPDLKLEYYNPNYTSGIPCNFFQYYSNDVCNYCDFNKIYDYTKEECVDCPNNMHCLGSEIGANFGFHVFNLNSIETFIFTEPCPLGLCLEGSEESINRCPTSQYDPDSPYCSKCTNDPSIGPSISKNALNCCQNVQPLLLFGYIAFILILTFIISLYKSNVNTKLTGVVIMLLQYNSIIFYSYPGLYILPLFRISMDFIFNYCTVRINTVYKLLVSIISLVFITVFGLSDIAYVILNSLRKNLFFSGIVNSSLSKEMKTNLDNYDMIKFLGINKSSSGIPSGMGTDIGEGKYDRSFIRIKQYYNYYLIMHQPIFFIIISTIIPKKVHSFTGLSIDFSYEFNSTPLHMILFSSSIILLLFFAFFIPLKLFINCFFSHLFEKKINTNSLITKKIKKKKLDNNNNSINNIFDNNSNNNNSININNYQNYNYNNNFNDNSINSNSIDLKYSTGALILIYIIKLFYNPNISKLYNSSTSASITGDVYKAKYRWWDFIIIFRNLIISFLVVSMVYLPYYYFLIIITIQSAYTLLHFSFKPQRNTKLYNFEIILNITNLLLYLILNSTLISNNKLKVKICKKSLIFI
ncbi:hypothetical protein DICPUDRAFT_83613 [Dictyostelium purpureum]|uniref:Uncharacterized protein n=1 Tax=Dictyostelium purpureum TaxID=5786 RepID=F1A026_DICPU|nr:uncharacterized protein DICPUDRAFT_83613 [Dictyostelium purpureum]EGC30463.1 hypothetical protein DICPUDRAFT_83613 [Dictyostelium purpureum]|eukprot:XP_003293018.1 hypothetical protein DICPUDRAFT_83613 [Dictyostelium purpureum]